MGKLGDDLIRSLEEAVDHAKGEGPGTEHASASRRDPDTEDTLAQAVDAEEAGQVEVTGAS